MEREERVCDTTAQAFIKLETALSLYRALESNASEQEKLLLLAALRDVKILLCDGEENITLLQQGIVKTVDNFGSHLGMIAINRLVHDVELIKRELENFDNGKECGKKEERKPKQLTNDDVELSDEDNQCFERITKRRRELLSEVEAFLPVGKDTKRAGFLPSRTILRNPVPSSDTTEDVPDRNQTNNLLICPRLRDI
ncbi:hypothetical protein AC249_AIPGENE9133 [Exaiptasia diaphana]|nr:hypothetical protein AC249_AIPGENE9133 [Exaiptasia diaphana]